MTDHLLSYPSLSVRGARLPLFGLLAGLSACTGSPPPPADAITIGLLLPFTGATSATANNFERATLYAADRINAHGGIKGRPIRIFSRDTQSDLDHSRQATAEIIAEGAVAVIGPESSEIAAGIAPMLADAHVAFISPLVGAANDTVIDCSRAWFRLAPSARALGESLAKLVYTENLRSTAVLFAAGAYNQALSDAVASRITSLGGKAALVLELDPAAQSYSDAVRQTVAANVDSIVLATSPRTGAHVVNEFEVTSGRAQRWFLSPLLKTDLLVKNVVPGALQNALGVAPKIYDTTPAFPTAFDQSWAGDQPLEGAYFYYDAMILLSFALEKSTTSSTTAIDANALQAAIPAAAAPPGVAAGWNEVENSMDLLGAGSNIYYSGLTGPLLLESCGSRQIGVTSTWQVQDDSTIATRPE